MTQQGLRQASARDLSGFATETNYNEDFLRLFDAQSIPAGTFNERQLMWINARMAASYTNLNDAMQAYATSQGAHNWSSMGALENAVYFTRVMPFGGTYTRTGSAFGMTVAGALTTFAADTPQRTDRGLALEPARTNLLLRSSEFDNATWTKSLATVTANATTAPDGTTTADKLIPNAGAASLTALARQTITKAAVATTYTVTVFFKASGYPAINIFARDDATSANSASVSFNTTTGAITSALSVTGTFSAGSTAAAMVLADGWLMARLTFTSGTETGLRLNVIPRDQTGDGVAGVFVWNAQIEAASNGSSPIVTGAATASRSLPAYTEPVPPARTKALLTYYDATTTLATGLTPGGTFDVATAVIADSKGRFGVSELASLVWQA